MDEVSPEDKMRIYGAFQIAAGMLSNPNTYEQHDWKNSVVFESVLIADKIITSVLIKHN